MTAQETRPHSHRRQSEPDAALLGLLSLTVWLTTFICLWRLQAVGVSRWAALLSLPIAGCAAGLMIAVAGWRERPERPFERAWTLLLISIVLLLGIIRTLLPVSLDAGRAAVRTQPLMLISGIVMLFLSMNFVAWYQEPRQLLRNVRLVGTTVILVALVFSSLPKSATILPAVPRPAASPVLLLAVAAIVLLAAFLARPGYGTPAAGGTADQQRDVPRSPVGAATLTAFLPALAAVALFALTRDLGTAVALLAAGIAVLLTARRNQPSASADRGAPAKAARPSYVGLLRASLSSAAIFAVLASLVIVFGMAIHIPRFSFTDALGYSDRQPAPFSIGSNLMMGAGLDGTYDHLWKGTSGSPPDVLSLIGHEAGVLCLIGLSLLFIAFFWSLARLTARIGNQTGTAIAWGLIVFLIAQFLLAAETLFPAGVPVGEGPPLLSGGWADYLADLVAIGIVIGLSRRGRRPMPNSVPTEAQSLQSPARTPA